MSLAHAAVIMRFFLKRMLRLQRRFFESLAVGRANNFAHISIERLGDGVQHNFGDRLIHHLAVCDRAACYFSTALKIYSPS